MGATNTQQTDGGHNGNFEDYFGKSGGVVGNAGSYQQTNHDSVTSDTSKPINLQAKDKYLQERQENITNPAAQSDNSPISQKSSGYVSVADLNSETNGYGVKPGLDLVGEVLSFNDASKTVSFALDGGGSVEYNLSDVSTINGQFANSFIEKQRQGLASDAQNYRSSAINDAMKSNAAVSATVDNSTSQSQPTLKLSNGTVYRPGDKIKFDGLEREILSIDEDGVKLKKYHITGRSGDIPSAKLSMKEFGRAVDSPVSSVSTTEGDTVRYVNGVKSSKTNKDHSELAFYTKGYLTRKEIKNADGTRTIENYQTDGGETFLSSTETYKLDETGRRAGKPKVVIYDENGEPHEQEGGLYRPLGANDALVTGLNGYYYQYGANENGEQVLVASNDQAALNIDKARLDADKATPEEDSLGNDVELNLVKEAQEGRENAIAKAGSLVEQNITEGEPVSAAPNLEYEEKKDYESLYKREVGAIERDLPQEANLTKIDITKNGFDEKHYQYSGLSDQGELARQFNESAQALQEKVDKIMQQVGDGIWDGLAVGKAKEFFERIKTDGDELKEAAALLTDVCKKADLMQKLSKELILLQEKQEYFEKKRNEWQEKLNDHSNNKPSTEVWNDNLQEYVPNPAYDRWEARYRYLSGMVDYCEERRKYFEEQTIIKNNKITSYENAIKYIQDQVKGVFKERDPNGDRERGSGDSEIEYIDNTQEQMKFYQEMDRSMFNSILSSLFALAKQENVTIDVLFTNDDYALAIRDMLLNSDYIPESMKILIRKGNIDISQKLLRQYVFAETNDAKDLIGINNVTKAPITDLLKEDANDENINSYVENGRKVKGTLNKFNDTKKYLENISNSNITEELSKAYNGDVSENFSNTNLTVTRSFLDELSSENNSLVDQMLTSNSNTLQTEINNLYSTSSFLSNINNYSDDGASTLIKNILK